MTQPSFDLIEQPWIPVLYLDGATTENLGLRALLHRAHELQAIYGESPLVTAALYRFLLALVYAIFDEPHTTREWQQIWQKGCFDKAAVDAYFARWQERFDLFHPKRPFFQWPDKANREKQAIDLFPDFASGSNATLFDHHTTNDNTPLRAEQAARGLLQIMTFCTSGGAGLAPKESSDAPWARGCVFLAEGNTIFETLMLNFLPPRDAGFQSNPQDRPFWESKNPFEPLRSVPLGMRDYLSWPIRAVYLVPEQQDGQLVVRKVFMGTGLKLEEIEHPVYAYRERASDKKRLFQRFNENRALWRDSSTFLNLKSNTSWPPKPIHWLAELVAEEILPRSQIYRVMVLGMANNQAKIDFYREEHFPLPGQYLQQPELVEALNQAITMAEDVRIELERSISRLATLLLWPTADGKNERKPDRKDIENLMGHWSSERVYWGSLEPAFFTLLQTLPHNPQAALQTWWQTLRTASLKTFERTARMAGENTRALRAAARAENQLYGSLKKLFEPRKE